MVQDMVDLFMQEAEEEEEEGIKQFTISLVSDCTIDVE
jgi:hypothetical protein